MVVLTMSFTEGVMVSPMTSQSTLPVRVSAAAVQNEYPLPRAAP